MKAPKEILVKLQARGASLLMNPWMSGSPLAVEQQILLLVDLIHFVREDPVEGRTGDRLMRHAQATRPDLLSNLFLASQVPAEEHQRLLEAWWNEEA